MSKQVLANEWVRYKYNVFFHWLRHCYNILIDKNEKADTYIDIPSFLWHQLFTYESEKRYMQNEQGGGGGGGGGGGVLLSLFSFSKL